MNFFNSFYADAMNGVHNLGSDTLKIALSNTLPVATNTKLSDITQIANGNGYITGGQALDNVTSAQVSGVYSLKADDEVFTASGGTMATWRYVVLYNDTATNDELIGWWDHGSSVTLLDTKTATIDFTDREVFTI
jgi:hypothetical protein